MNKPMITVMMGVLTTTSVAFAVVDSKTVTATADSRDYTLTVASAHGTPVPSIGTNLYAWRTAITCSVASVVEQGVDWQVAGWSGTGSIPASGATNTTGAIILTDLESSIAWRWNWETALVITNSDNTLTITGYIGTGTEMTIPSEINGIPVTSIGDNAFQNCASLINVVIPTSVTNIGARAFQNCSGLTNVTIGGGVTSIGWLAFLYCQSLPSITIPSSVTHIEAAAFVMCSNLTAITVDKDNSFYSSVDGVLFDKLETTLIRCPEGKPGSYSIPAGVTNIGNIAFYACVNLTHVIIPASATIGNIAFKYCDNLTAITVDKDNSFYSSVDGVLFDKLETTLIQYPGGKAGSYTVPDSVASIEDDAFNACLGLTNVIISGHVTSIGFDAFTYCTNLTSVMIAASVTHIGPGAFSSCTSLTGVYFEGNAPNPVDSYAFLDSTNTTVYRLSGAAGWPPVPDLWAGRPTALWQQLNSDLDSDGIPDSWEQQHFGGTTNANPNAVCSNGFNTVHEAYIAGLNPNDPQSVFRASAPSKGKVLDWNAVSGRVYSVYWTTNLMNGFQCLESNIPWTRGSFTNPTTVPCGYYKIDVRLE